MKIAIVKYNAGNTQSVYLALQRFGVEVVVTNNIDDIQSSDKVIFPGVGEASSAMHFLQQKKLDKAIKALKQPVLGICLGMQLMCAHSEEGDTTALGIFENGVKRFISTDDKVPHTGWNNVRFNHSELYKEIPNNEYYYFVHSYYAETGSDTSATCEYAGVKFSASLQKDNFYGVQFHPEKSSDQGILLLKNFIEL